MSSTEHKRVDPSPHVNSEVSADIVQHFLEETNPYSAESQSKALKQMAQDSEFAEDIGEKMTIPERLVFAEQSPNSEPYFSESAYYARSGIHRAEPAFRMEVPDRIVVSVGDQGVQYGGSNEAESALYLSRFNEAPPMQEKFSLTTPPRTLTLVERNLDTLDIPTSYRGENDDGSDSNANPKTDNKLSRNQIVPGAQQTDSSEEADEITVMRRQIFKLHRRITNIEKREAEKSTRDMCFYAATVAFWLLNGWFLYSRRPY